jgi:hypothetical protein
MWWSLLGCQRGDDAAHTGSPPGPHSAPAEPEVRCSDLVAGPLTARPHPTARAFHDVAFDEGGNLFGGHAGGWWRYPFEGEGALVATGLGDVHQVDWLEPGVLLVAVADADWLERLDTTTGGRIPVAPGAYAVRRGPGGDVWTADGTALYRSTPGVWDRETLVDTLPDGDPKVVAFDREGTTAYLGTIRGTGVVYTLALDAEGAPVGEPAVFATGVGGGWHDALGVDACGNVYVADAVETALYRLGPDGAVERVLDLAVEDHAHGLRWGSGVGGWRSDALYLAQPYGGDHVAEVVVGVPAADWRGGNYTVVP